MQSVTFVFLAAAVTVAFAAAGQYYVPRAYYIIDSEGHESAPVPLRRLRREIAPYPWQRGSATANSEAIAIANGGDATANSNARAISGGRGGRGSWDLPSNGGYGAANPAALGGRR